MSPTRRDFMRSVGVALASVLAVRCRPWATCYTPVVPTLTPSAGEGGAWGRLAEPWDNLDLLARDAQDLERGDETLEQLVTEHRAALDDLIQAGELDAAVADDIQAAFDGAAYHVWRANAPITCYIPAPGPDYQVESSSDLTRQADLLAEMATTSAIDEATVAQAQAAIERDIAYLSMPADEQQALIDALMQAAGDTRDYPTLAELDLDILPESITAARILVELLLGGK